MYQFDESGAPNRDDYYEQEQGYERYLYDLDEWAQENYREALDGRFSRQ